MGNEGSNVRTPSNSGYSSVRTHRRNSSASLSMVNSDVISTMIEQSSSKSTTINSKPKAKRLKSTSSLYRSKNTMDEDGNITIGSYCYCDCDTYFVVVTDILENDNYKIVDLFEQRSRVCYTRNLKLIDDDSKLRIAQQQHKTYLLDTNRDSNNS